MGMFARLVHIHTYDLLVRVHKWLLLVGISSPPTSLDSFRQSTALMFPYIPRAALIFVSTAASCVLTFELPEPNKPLPAALATRSPQA
jgi:hypothetical protein